MYRYRRPSNLNVLCSLGGLFTTLVGFSFTRFSSAYTVYLGWVALASGLATFAVLMMLQILPRKRRLWSLILLGVSISYWAVLFVTLGSYSGFIWGLAGPVYTLTGAALGFRSRPVMEESTLSLKA